MFILFNTQKPRENFAVSHFPAPQENQSVIQYRQLILRNRFGYNT